MKKSNLEKQLETFKRGSVCILTEEELVAKLNEDRPLNIKFGVDPTAPDIHLGHTVPLQKLKQFQDFGHNIQLIIGDYTAMIGDPSGRSETRPMLTREQIESNLKTYKDQVFKILDPQKTKLFYNSSWLGKFSGTDIINLGAKYTVQQLLQRRDFGERIRKNTPLSVTELIYPLLVGYDSVHLNSDVELGGTDQLFNFMASREIQKAFGQKPEVILTLPLLEGTDGEKKMSKSLGNAIGINENPINIYGKIMSISDTLMIRYFELISDISTEEFQSLKKEIDDGGNPMIYKQKLAREIVTRYHGIGAANAAEEHFNKVHRKRKMPSEFEELILRYKESSDLNIVNLLKQTGRATSNSEARRLIEQGGVKIDGQVISDIKYNLEPKSNQVLQVGKLFYRKIRYERES